MRHTTLALCVPLAAASLAGCVSVKVEKHQHGAVDRDTQTVPVSRQAGETRTALRANGWHGFPAADAVTLCDEDELLFRVWNDDEVLVAQSIFWGDSTDALGETGDGRPIGDSSSLLLDLNNDGERTPDEDLDYTLNPWPHLPGLRYDVVVGRGMTTGLQGDAEGRGAIRYVELVGGGAVRVDTYVVSLDQHVLSPGDTVGIGFMATNRSPEVRVNSIGFTTDAERYYPHSLSYADLDPYTLRGGSEGSGGSMDVALVPDDRSLEQPREAPRIARKPRVGELPPAIDAASWINTDDAPSLESLRGSVAVIEFWATWCGPCVANIPHLNELHTKHAGDGLVIVALTDQSERGIASFLDSTPMDYTIGAGSDTFRAYGVTGIPHAFVLGRDGTIVWQGHPATPGMETAIADALEG